MNFRDVAKEPRIISPHSIEAELKIYNTTHGSIFEG